MRICQIAPSATGKELDVTNDNDIRDIGTILREVVRNNWSRIPSAPSEGDVVSARGESVFQLFDTETKSFDVEWFSGAIEGQFDGIDVQPYLDEMCFVDAAEDIDMVNLEGYIRPFGLHLVLRDARLVGDGEAEFDEGSRLYIPLQYSTTRLSTLPAA
ncbi:hypothetical protein D3C79_788750 [compost metagenome]